MIRTTAAGFALLAFTTVVQAGPYEGSAYRFGIGAADINVQTDGTTFDDSSWGFQIYGGFEFNKWLAVEAGYLGGAEPSDVITGVTIEGDLRAWQASALGSWWFTEWVSVFGRAGVLAWKTEERALLGGNVIATRDEDGTDPYFGAGLAFMIDQSLLRLEYNLAEIEDSDVESFGLNITWRF